eukprot:8602080-Ditylum_brightwellii.AAC.1
MEEVVEHVVPKADNCVCLLTRFEAGGHSHPFQSAIYVWERGKILTCRCLEPSWVFLGGSSGRGCKAAISHPC